MSFDPRSPIGGPYHLAIASESGNRPLSIVDATSESTIRKAYMHDRGQVQRPLPKNVRPPPSRGRRHNVSNGRDVGIYAMCGNSNDDKTIAPTADYGSTTALLLLCRLRTVTTMSFFDIIPYPRNNNNNSCRSRIAIRSRWTCVRTPPRRTGAAEESRMP